MPTTYFLGLGSNVGDRAAHLAAARAALKKVGMVAAVSPIFETAPVGPGTRAFLNQAVQLSSQLKPQPLLAALQKIEQKLGRQPRGRWADREIDLDILLAGEVVLWRPDLQIPHAELAHRRFALAPLVALAPALRHPVLRLPLATLLKLAPANPVKKWKT